MSFCCTNFKSIWSYQIFCVNGNIKYLGVGNICFSIIIILKNFIFQAAQELPRRGSSRRLKNKDWGLPMSNHRYDDTFGPGLLQIFLYERRLPILYPLLYATTIPSTGTRSPLWLVHWLRGIDPFGWNRWSLISFWRTLEVGSFGWYRRWRAILLQEEDFLALILCRCSASLRSMYSWALRVALLNTGRILWCWNPRSSK